MLHERPQLPKTLQTPNGYTIPRDQYEALRRAHEDLIQMHSNALDHAGSIERLYDQVAKERDLYRQMYTKIFNATKHSVYGPPPPEELNADLINRLNEEDVPALTAQPPVIPKLTLLKPGVE